MRNGPQLVLWNLFCYFTTLILYSQETSVEGSGGTVTSIVGSYDNEQEVFYAIECTEYGVSQDVSSKMVIGQADLSCIAQHPMRGPRMICFLNDILKSIHYGPHRERFARKYLHMRKVGGANVRESQELWKIIWAKQNENPLIQSMYFFSGMLSAPENLEYVLITWTKLSEKLNRSNNAIVGSLFALYLVAWTINNWVGKNGSDPEHIDCITLPYHRTLCIPRTKEGAMRLVEYCIEETKDVINFVLTPYFHITVFRWKFEIERDSGTLNETAASRYLKSIDETFEKCWFQNRDWMKADAFGAMVSAVNLKIEIALYFRRREQNDKFCRIKGEAMDFLNPLNEYFEDNHSLITIYDCAWLSSVRSKFFYIDGYEQKHVIVLNTLLVITSKVVVTGEH